MPEITTLTLNPAYDVHVNIDTFTIHRENTADSVSRDIGGKGINISRALNENKIANTAILILGNDNSGDFKSGVKKEGLDCKIIECDGRIRENITVHPSDGKETRLSFKGFSCDASLLCDVEKLIPDGGIVTFTGSLPEGITAEDAEVFLVRLKERGVKLVIDSKSVTLEMLRRIKPWLIKPNSEEIEAYFGGKMSEDELYKKALELGNDGIENVMISLGGDGAILANGGEIYRAYVPKIDVRSTIGAGDSSIAGFICADGDSETRLKTAVSYGSAACLREGTNPPLGADIEKIYSNVRIEKINF
ncbi:MAG: 1-phosphofructokinase family hexose kinase [Clostridia bacterium]|nr:1-phosphofructokinase family hexose kinase [Clostridia bacterium]